MTSLRTAAMSHIFLSSIGPAQMGTVDTQVLDIQGRPFWSPRLLCRAPVSIVGPLGSNTSATSPLFPPWTLFTCSANTCSCQRWAVAWGKREKCLSPWCRNCLQPPLSIATQSTAFAEASLLQVSHTVDPMTPCPYPRTKLPAARCHPTGSELA